MTTYLGADIIAVEQPGFASLRVTFASSHAMRHQLYYGRTLVAVTADATTRDFVVSLEPQVTPVPLQVLAIDSTEDGAKDNGALLPKRPYNLHRLTWSVSGLESDTDRFVITGSGGVEGGSPVDSDILGAIDYRGDGSYQFDLPALECSGVWKYGVKGYDSTCGATHATRGNAGTESVATIDADVYPPDVVAASDGTRFTVSVASGTATIGVQHP